MNIKKKFQDFILKSQPGIFGIMVAYVIGISTNSFLKSFVTNIIMPLLGKLLDIEKLTTLSVQGFGVGATIADLVYLVLVIAILFFVIEYALKRMVTEKPRDESEESEDKLVLKRELAIDITHSNEGSGPHSKKKKDKNQQRMEFLKSLNEGVNEKLSGGKKQQKFSGRNG
jgi:large-conductance mechanosensitive channel